MKKKGLAAILAVIMTISSFCIPAYARYDVTGSQYTFRDTTDLEIDYDPGTEQIVLTWPAVDKEGNLIKDNPLRAEGQIESNGNPTRGWTNPTNGMIIAYDGWLPDGTHNSVSNDNKSDHNVIMGLVDYETEYPVYVKDPKSTDEATSSTAVKIGYIDTTVVTESLATGYLIEYSKDGVSWTTDHTASTINHGKKLTRLKMVENKDTGLMEEKLVDDNKNTFFLEDQITEAMTSSLEPDTKYYVRVTAYDASKALSASNPAFKVFTSEFTTPAAAEKTPAFATVEGGGTYSQGGRGGDVYVVTNLSDSVSDPQPGSLRYGLLRKDRADSDSSAPRTIVFAVGGTIQIDEAASKSERRLNINDNTTILGQTAPGEGITVAGASIKFSGNDIIVRYMHFRLGSGYDLDAATASGRNIVIDHCSFSWGVDEVFSAKEVINSSIQYNIFSSGLAVPDKNGIMNTDPEINSGESEAKHGMGSILNGYDTSYTHNLWAHNGTRNPRFEGGFEYNGVRYENKIDYANNVVYNWGHNSTYGGERGNGQMNFVGNYYKPGPETLEKVKYQFVDCDGNSTYKSSYYIDGNVMTSSAENTADNVKGFSDLATGAANVLTEPVSLTVPYTATTADEAYNKVLATVGASLHRDAHDARLIYEVENGLGAFVNDQTEAGGWSTATYTSELTDSDNDGLPDEYELQNGLNPQDASDSAALVTDEASIYYGYSNIEVYAGNLVGDWTTMATAKDAPNVQIEQILDAQDNNILAEDGNTTLIAGETYRVIPSKAVTDTDIYLNDKIVTDNNLTFTVSDTGVYNLSCLSTENGYSSFSVAVPVTVVAGVGNLEGFTSVDIGTVGATGADNYDATTGTLYSQGAGRIGRTNTSSIQGPDAFHFNYKEVTGDFEFVARMDNLAKIDYAQKSGIMVRSSLDDRCEFYMAGLTYLKGEDYTGTTDVTGESVKAKNIMAFMRLNEGQNSGTGKFLGVPITRIDREKNIGYGKITRVGDIITISASLDGTQWYTLAEYTSKLPDTCYVGFATEAAQDTSEKVRYNATAFSEITLSETGTTTLLGDVDCNGNITADDASLIMQYVLDATSVDISEQGLINAKVLKENIYSANTASSILQKTLNGAFLFPVER